MARSVSRSAFIDDLHARTARHREILGREFGSRSEDVLRQAPAPGSWSVAQCFDHLAATYDYYRPRIEAALAQARSAGVAAGSGGKGAEGEASGPGNDGGSAGDERQPAGDDYRPSLWGRIYMSFALNSRWSFKVADEMAPEAAPGPEALAAYEERLDWLVPLVDSLGETNLSNTRVPLQGGVAFNLGDCLRVLVYHDTLHFRQARKALAVVDAARDEEQA